MNFTLYNLSSANTKLKISNSQNAGATLLDPKTFGITNTPASPTVFVDNGVVNGCIAGNSADVVITPYKATGPINSSIKNLQSVIANTNDSRFLNVIYNPTVTGTIPAGVFSSGSSIRQLSLINCDLDAIANNAFQNVTIRSFINLSTRLESIGDSAFSKSGILNTPNLQMVKSIGANAFEYNHFNQIILSNSLNNLGVAAFLGCGNLQTIQIPPSVKVIPDQLLSGCSGLTTVDFTSLWDGVSQVTSFGAKAFDSCYSLTNILLPWVTPPALDPEAFGNLMQLDQYNQLSYIAFKVSVPKAGLSAYQNDKNWSVIKDYIVGV